jgi:hypothetical protein
MDQSSEKLVTGDQLLDQLFGVGARPTLRWLRYQQKRRAVPFIKIGHLVRYDPERVKAAWAKRFTVEVAQ